MKPTVLLTTVAVGIAAAAACNRADAEREAREAAADIRTVAAEAGDRLADSWLTAKVQAKFFADDEIKARYIDVSSRDGAVTLQGFVETDAVRQKAVQLARSTDGVNQVDDRLLIGQSPQVAANTPSPSPTAPLATTGSEPSSPDGGAVPDDGMVTSLIQSRYFLDPSIKVRDIEVQSTNGVVTLRGKVASDEERARALLLARTTRGVQRVEDGLTIDASLAPPLQGPPAATGTIPSTPIAGATSAAAAAAAGASAPAVPGAVATGGERASDSSLEREIRSRFNRDRQLQGARIDISARDGVVLLQGAVGTRTAKQRALTIAQQSEGVMQVVDRIVVKE